MDWQNGSLANVLKWHILPTLSQKDISQLSKVSKWMRTICEKFQKPSKKLIIGISDMDLSKAKLYNHRIKSIIINISLSEESINSLFDIVKLNPNIPLIFNQEQFYFLAIKRNLNANKGILQKIHFRWKLKPEELETAYNVADYQQLKHYGLNSSDKENFDYIFRGLKNQKKTSLEYLYLSANMKTAIIKDTLSLPIFRTLTKLTLKHRSFCACAKETFIIPSNILRQLRSLKIERCKVHESESFFKDLLGTNIHTLVLSNCSIDTRSKGTDLIQFLQKNYSLKKLNLDDNIIDRVFFTQLCDTLKKNSDFEYLSILRSNCYFDMKDIDILKNLNPKIKFKLSNGKSSAYYCL